MRLSGYISEVAGYQRIEFTPSEKKLLDFLRYISVFSKYSLYVDLNKVVTKIAYKNVLKKVDKFEKLRLIERISKDDERIKYTHNIHGAVYYTISTKGLFFMLYNLDFSHEFIISRWDNVIVQTLISPYFEKETFRKMKVQEHFILVEYLQDCFKKTFRFSEKLKDGPEHRGAMSQREYNRKCEIELSNGLRFAARIFAYKVVTGNDLIRINKKYFDEDNSKGPYETPPRLPSLAEDVKFMKLLYETKNEFEVDYKHFKSK